MNALGAGSRPHSEVRAAHIVLLGDSVFDNVAYVARGEDVTAQFRARQPNGWSTTLLARDGAALEGVEWQVRSIPEDATHLVVSAGGNDALRYAAVLRETVRSMAEAIERLASIREDFAQAYEAMLARVLAPGLPTTICTIYDAQLPDPMERRIASTALCVLNDVILRAASARRLPVLDLRVLFAEPGYFANAIEPSVAGGARMAEVILSLVRSHEFGRPAPLYAA